MKESRRNEILGLMLSRSGQLAYAEDAYGTAEALQRLNFLFRYLIDPEESAIVRDEISALENYFNLLKIWHPGRFSWRFSCSPELCEGFIKRLVLLSFGDQIMINFLDSGTAESELVFLIEEENGKLYCDLKDDFIPGNPKRCTLN